MYTLVDACNISIVPVTHSLLPTNTHVVKSATKSADYVHRAVAGGSEFPSIAVRRRNQSEEGYSPSATAPPWRTPQAAAGWPSGEVGALGHPPPPPATPRSHKMNISGQQWATLGAGAMRCRRLAELRAGAHLCGRLHYDRIARRSSISPIPAGAQNR
eukprot:1179465-Prorocentrum_minimum.AAC.2